MDGSVPMQVSGEFMSMVTQSFPRFAHVCVDGKPVGKVRLVFDETIEREKEPERSFWEKLFGGNP